MSRFLDELEGCRTARTRPDLLRAGVTRRALAGAGWDRPSRGLHRASTQTPPTTAQRILDAAALLPRDAVIGGWAAAYAHGVDLLNGLDDVSMAALPVPVFQPPGLHRLAIPGVRYVQQARLIYDADQIAGIWFTRPLQTAMDLGRWARGLGEATVVLDAMLAAGVIDKQRLQLHADLLRGARHVRQLRAAADLSEPGVRSSWESRLRMFWCLDLGLPRPLVNPELRNRWGTIVAVPDLLDATSGLALEYDGVHWESESQPDGHLDPERMRKDNVREELLERLGLIVVRCQKHDLTRHRSELGARLLAARVQGLARDRTLDRWTLAEK